MGQIVYGSLKGRDDMVVTGRRLALIGAALFVAGAFFFELDVGISGIGLGLDGFGWPLGLVIVGIVLLVGGFLHRQR